MIYEEMEQLNLQGMSYQPSIETLELCMAYVCDGNYGQAKFDIRINLN